MRFGMRTASEKLLEEHGYWMDFFQTVEDSFANQVSKLPAGWRFECMKPSYNGLWLPGILLCPHNESMMGAVSLQSLIIATNPYEVVASIIHSAFEQCQSEHAEFPKLETGLKWNSNFAVSSSFNHPLSPSTYKNDIQSTLGELFPAAATTNVKCPVKKSKEHPHHNYEDRLLDVVIHLNDTHEWTRQQIADWLDSLSIDLTLQPISKGG